MKAKYNDLIRYKNLDSNDFYDYILQQPSTEYRPLFRNSHQRKFYKEVKHYNNNAEDNILYTDSPLGEGTIGKSEGDVIEVKVEGKINYYKIIEIRR